MAKKKNHISKRKSVPVRRLFLISALLCLTGLLGCNTKKGASKIDTPSEVKTDLHETEAELEEAINYEVVTIQPDYMAAYPKDMYEIAKVVVKGHFGEKVGVYINERNAPVTQIEFECEEVFKGEVESKDIIAGYFGGTIPLSMYLDTLSESEIEELAKDLTPEEIDKATITYSVTGTNVSVNKDDTYLLFLAYHEDRDTYYILCDAYGACKMEGDKVYSLMEKKYVDTSFLIK